MTTKTFLSRLPLLVGLTLAGASTAAWAQPGPGGPGGPGFGPGPRGHHHGMALCLPKGFVERMSAYDTDKNGYLDPAEHQAMREARRAEALAQFDKDGDGQLSKEERTELHHARTVEHFELLDDNGDASISRAEAEASCTPLAWRFDQVDSDSDGVIEWTEFEAAAPQRGMRGMHGMHGMHGKRGKWGQRGMHGHRGRGGMGQGPCAQGAPPAGQQ
ncbi:EF-hand domain-containing protein [Haliangium sp.]|uniref:EF-hand domain-containing protein n=1 Tax=Haliangium sp. TaxID=2663208 RepID=UPI003D120650